MEDVKQFGDPDKLMSEEDLIILRLDRPCPRRLPDQLTVDATGQLVSMNQGGFIGCKEILSNQQVSAALFAGCSAFDSLRSFENAAELILRNVRTLVVLHNRNLVCDLFSKSRYLRHLVLFHNIRLQIAEDPFWCPSKRSSPQLEKLVGTMPALGVDCLLMDSVVLFLATCNSIKPTLVQTPMEQFFSARAPDGTATLAGLGILTEHLILGVRVKALNGTMYLRGDATPACLARARRDCHNVQGLEVTTSSPESLLKIAEFKGLRRLSITAAFDDCSFHRYILPLLKRFDLEVIALANFDCVQLSLIASFCKNITSLSLENCSIVAEATFGSFPKLRKLHLESTIMEECLVPFLSGCRNVEDIELDVEAVGIFIAIAPNIGFHKLERLVLNSDKPLWSPEIGDDELRRFLKSLPSLRYLATDCYGIRLFFETHAPQVTLAWASCTICMAEFPKINEVHRKMWHAFMVPK